MLDSPQTTASIKEITSYIQDYIDNCDLKSEQDVDEFLDFVIMPLAKTYSITGKISEVFQKHNMSAALEALSRNTDKNINMNWDTLAQTYGVVATGIMKLVLPERPEYLQLVATWGIKHKIKTDPELEGTDWDNDLNKIIVNLQVTAGLSKMSYDDWEELAICLKQHLAYFLVLVNVGKI